MYWHTRSRFLLRFLTYGLTSNLLVHEERGVNTCASKDGTLFCPRSTFDCQRLTTVVPPLSFVGFFSATNTTAFEVVRWQNHFLSGIVCVLAMFWQTKRFVKTAVGLANSSGSDSICFFNSFSDA